jgi:fucose permease
VDAVRRGYLDQALVGYLVYGVGAVTAFLAVRLALTDTEAGLHSSTLALGFVAAGLSGDLLDRRLHMRRTHYLGLAALTVAIFLIVSAAALPVTLLGAAAAGFGAGLLVSHVNQVLSAGGGTVARMRLARAALVGVSSSALAPIVIGMGELVGSGWQIVVVPALLAAAVGFIATRRFEERPAPESIDPSRLPRAFWMVWTLLVLGIAVEFAAVFWAGSLVRQQTGVSLAQATLSVAAFSGGMVLGRVALSSHAISAREPIRLMRAGIVLAALATLVVWASRSYELSMLAMFVAGIGIAVLFPLGTAVSLETVPGREQVASSRLVLASGTAILAAPFILGVAADSVGVTPAWLLLPAMCLGTLALTVPVARDRGRTASP